MWVIEGPFDGTETGTLPASKCKLLKPGRTYPVGRKAKQPLQLVINHAKVSHEHAAFSVGEHSVDDASSPSTIPPLTIFNLRPKMIQLERNRTRVVVNPSAAVELQHGDCIALVSGVYVRVTWRPVCCLLPAKSPSIPFHACAALGLKLVASAATPAVTHHLLPLLSASPAVARSTLIPAQLVTPAWLTELLRRGAADAPCEAPQSQPVDPALPARCALECDFALPAEAAYRPPVDPALPPALQAAEPWAPNAARQNLFAGWRFVLVHAGREPDADTRALVERGGGEYEALDISAAGGGSPTRVQQTLERNTRKAQKGICVVGNVDTLKVAAAGSWNALADVLRASNLRILDSTVLSEAVLYVDVSRLDSTQGVEAEPISMRAAGAVVQIDNQIQEEESGPRRRPLRRRVTPASRAASTPPEPAPEASAPAPVPVLAPVVEAAPDGPDARRSEEPEGGRRKPLVRRVKASRVILGVDDPSFSELPPPASLSAAFNPAQPSPSIAAAAAPAIELDPTPAPASASVLVPPTPSTLGRPSRLKRRTRADDTAPLNPILAGLQKELAEADLPQPPLKKFRALFDETDPDRVPASSGAPLFSGGIVEESQSLYITQLETQTAAGITRSAAAPGSGRGLGAVPEEEEEEEESESVVGPAPPRPAGAGIDVQMLDVPASQTPDASTKSASKSSKPLDPSSSTQEREANGILSSEKAQGVKKANVGAAPGKPDTDAAFLRALASTKRGKKHEDAFDREFNNLRISKPDLERERVRAQEAQERQAEEWKLLADFGDEAGVRGNFMVIVEMEVPEHRAGGAGSREPAQERPEWRGKPDFKAFRKKNSHRSQSAVELVVNDENDYGMGSAYWKGGSQSQSQPEIFSQDEPPVAFLQRSQTQSRGFLKPPSQASAGPGGPSRKAPRGQSQSRGVKAEPEEGGDVERLGPGAGGKGTGTGKGKERARAASRARTGTKGARGGEAGTDQPLFLETLDEEEDGAGGLGPEELEEIELDLDAEEDDEGEDEDEEARVQTTRRAPARKASSAASPSRGKKRAAAVLDDDSDTGMTFRGFAGRKKARAK